MMRGSSFCGNSGPRGAPHGSSLMNLATGSRPRTCIGKCIETGFPEVGSDGMTRASSDCGNCGLFMAGPRARSPQNLATFRAPRSLASFIGWDSPKQCSSRNPRPRRAVPEIGGRPPPMSQAERPDVTRSGAGLPRRVLDEALPILHELAPLGQRIGSAIGALGCIADGMGESGFDHLARMPGFVPGPIREA
jgi:hypothetical protein